MITKADLKNWTGTMFLDMADGYQNHFKNVDYPRLTFVDTGPKGKRRRSRAGYGQHKRTFYVDGITITGGLEEILERLNREPPDESTALPGVHEPA